MTATPAAPETRRRRLVGTLSASSSAAAAAPPPLAFAPDEGAGGAGDEDENEGAGVPHDPLRSAAMCPILWDVWHAIDAQRVERLDALILALGDEIHRWRLVIHKHAAQEGSTRRTWQCVGSFEDHRDATIEAIRTVYGPGRYRAHLYAVRSDDGGRDYNEQALVFGFGIAAPATPSASVARSPAAPAAPPIAPPASPAPVGGALPGLPSALASASLTEQLAYLQATTQIELARTEAEERREERRARAQREEDDRRELAEERRRARQREEDERRDRDEDRRRARQRDEDERRERDEEKRAQRQRDLEARVLDMREQQIAQARSPLESLKSYRATIEEVRDLFGADGGKDRGSLSSILSLLGEGLGPHVPRLLEIAGTAINNKQRIDLMETQIQAALAAEQYRHNPPRVGAPPPPAPAAPAQHADGRIEVTPASSASSAPAPAAPPPPPATGDDLPASGPAEGAAPAPALAVVAPAPAELAPAAVAAAAGVGVLSPAPVVAPVLADVLGQSAAAPDEDGCPTCEPCECPEGEDCTCEPCPHGYALGDEDTGSSP